MEASRPIIPVEEQFQIMADSAPVLMWIAGTDRLCYFFNAGWLNFTGRTLEQEYGNGWADGVHPDDLQRCLEIYTGAFDARREFKMEYRLRRFDGVYQWLLDHGVPRFTADGSFAGYIGSCMVIDELLESMRVKKDFISREAFQQGQFVNEQLTATNEGLQTSNEELAAVNGALLNTQKALEQTSNQLLFTLNAIPNQVWTATAEGALNYVNEVVCEDFGYSATEIVGQGWQRFIHPDDIAGCLEQWTHALQSGTQYDTEFRLKFRDGGYRWHLARAVPFREDGQIKLWLGTNTDIHAQKTNEQRKDEFMSIASHELKTPLTSIKAFNQIMQRAGDPEKIRSFLQRSGEHIIRLERLINDLLDVTKINVGKMVFESQPFDFSIMIIEVIESNRNFSAKHEILLENEAKVNFTGDRYRLEQVLNNFISNAVKYSPNGKKIIVKTKTIANNIVVSVQDFGIGIAKENLDKLFDRYYRVDNTAMRFEGLGLGLFISSEILKRHKGSFWIESELGKGSTFFFLLPLPETTKAVVQHTATFYKDETISIRFNAEKDRLDVDWTGFQNLETVQAGCIRMWEMLKQHQVHKIVNDNTHVLGSWSSAVEWTGNTWFPMMEKAGLKYFALIYSPSVFSQLSAEKSIDVGIGTMTARYFTEVELAEQWVDTCK